VQQQRVLHMLAALPGAKVKVAATAAVAAAVLPKVTAQQRSGLSGPVLHQHVASVQAAFTASPPDISAWLLLVAGELSEHQPLLAHSRQTHGLPQQQQRHQTPVVKPCTVLDVNCFGF
jgi:hypothetical protein